MTPMSFPVVSFKQFLTGSEDAKRAVAQEIYDAFHTFGWVYLTDFGISEDEVGEMFAMVCLQPNP
jgi:isopenicillin N synthase-like dioxygenase